MFSKLILYVLLILNANALLIIKTQSHKNILIGNYNSNYRKLCKPLYANEITEFGEDEFQEEKEAIIETHGYEGNFKVGDIVKVNKHIRLWNVKPYTKDGFDSYGFIGKVNSLQLYGRKYKTLCSAITPVKVEFEPNSEGIPPNMFERKWMAHFSGEELDLIQAAIIPSSTDSNS